MLNVAFDFDGTLISCENKQKYVLFSILKSMIDVGNISWESLNYWWQLKRNGYTSELALVEMKFSNAKMIAEKWVGAIENYPWSYLDKPFNDSVSALEYLKMNYEVNLIIITARVNKYQVYQSLNSFGFSKFVSEVIVVNPYNAVAEKEKWLKILKPCIYVGDTETDYSASANSNTKFVALNRGQRSEGFLKRIGPIQVEENLSFLRSDIYVKSLVKGCSF
jgi:phosphoglycolate phosphatase-like HAD superfamily hydrolase